MTDEAHERRADEAHERRADDPRWAEMSVRMGTIEDQLAANTMLTQQVATNTAELVALFESAKGFLRFGRLLGSAAKWLAQVAAAALIFWALFRYGVGEAIRDLTGGHK